MYGTKVSDTCPLYRTRRYFPFLGSKTEAVEITTPARALKATWKTQLAHLTLLPEIVNEAFDELPKREFDWFLVDWKLVPSALGKGALNLSLYVVIFIESTSTKIIIPSTGLE
ncbi:hypothetical protein TorRG33x02_019850 [Trema orientale]|uniref:Uncharacterized protein n=1 Tax=Trema orientale TaxID=63057 RepID=A0A2P5FWL8_TREOI|nr:hypothetical protein TorRG33x02_019850 [Trema orientale]